MRDNGDKPESLFEMGCKKQNAARDAYELVDLFFREKYGYDIFKGTLRPD